MTDTNPRQRYTAAFLTAVMVIGMIAMGAFVAMPTAADEDPTPGADIPEYDAPDPTEFDLAVTAAGDTASDLPADYEDEFEDGEVFETIQDALDELEDNDSIIVFDDDGVATSYEDISISAVVADSLTIASYDGNQNVTIDAAASGPAVSIQNETPVELVGIGLEHNDTDENLVEVTNDNDSLTIDHGYINASDNSVIDTDIPLTVMNTVVETDDSETAFNVEGEVAVDNSILNNSDTAIDFSGVELSVSNSNLSNVETGITASGASSVDVSGSLFTEAGTGVSFDSTGILSVEESAFEGAFDTGISVADAAMLDLNSIDFNGEDNGVAIDIEDYDESAEVTDISVSDAGQALNVTAESGLELTVDGLDATDLHDSEDAAVYIDSEIRHISISDSDFDVLADGAINLVDFEDDRATTVSLTGLTVNDSAATAINVSADNADRLYSLELSDITVTHADTDGIDIDAAVDVRESFELSDVSVEGAATAVSIDDLVFPDINDDGLEVSDLSLSENDNGLVIGAGVDTDTLSVTDVDATDGSGTGIDVQMDGAESVTISNVNASANDVGVSLADDAGDSVTVSDSEISHNEGDGLDIGDADDVTVSNIEASGNEGSAVNAADISTDDGLTVEDSEFDENAVSINVNLTAGDVLLQSNVFQADDETAIELNGDNYGELEIIDTDFWNTEGIAMHLYDSFGDDVELELSDVYWGDDTGPTLSTTAGEADEFYSLGAEIVDAGGYFDEDIDDLTPWLDADGEEVFAFYGEIDTPAGDDLAGEEVTLDFEHLSSGVTGTFVFDNTSDTGEYVAVVDRAGSHNATANAMGYAVSDFEEFTISSNDYIEGGVDFELNTGGQLSADVVGPANNTPEEGTDFELVDAETDEVLTTAEYQDGEINVSVSPGEYDVYLTHDDSTLFPNSSVHTYDLSEAGEVVEGDTFEMGGQLEMTVEDADGDAVNGTVYNDYMDLGLFDADDEVLGEYDDLELDPNGTTTINLTADDFSAYAEPNDLANFTHSDLMDFAIEGGEDNATEVTFELYEPDMATLTITVEDDDGALTGETASVDVTDAAPPAVHLEFPDEVELDDDGQAELRVPAHEDHLAYNVQVTVEGYQMAERGVAPSPGEEPTRTFTLTAEDPAPTFELSDLEVPEDVNESESFDVTATVENTGDAEGTQNITLSIDGDEYDSTEVTLDADENDTVTFENVSIDEAGEYELTVASDDDEISANVNVSEVEPDEEHDIEMLNLLLGTESVEQGGTVTATATLMNHGDEAGETEVTLTYDGVEQNQTVEVPAGATQSAVFFVDTTDLEPGEYTIEAHESAGNTSATATLTVEEPPEPEAHFDLSDLDAPETVDEDEAFDVSVLVTNDGDAEGTQTITLTHDGDELASEELTLEAGADETVTFADVAFEEAGEYTITVSSDDAELEHTVTVEEVDPDTPTPTPSPTPTETPPDDDDGVPGFGVAIALMALMGAALLAYRRHQG